MAARKLLKDTCPLAAAILAGDHDADLANILAAAQARTKSMWRKGMAVRFVGTKNPALEGKTGTILKVNTKTITVGAGDLVVRDQGTPWEYKDWSGGEWNVSPGLLAKIDAPAGQARAAFAAAPGRS
jgi:hypothetical protein